MHGNPHMEAFVFFFGWISHRKSQEITVDHVLQLGISGAEVHEDPVPAGSGALGGRLQEAFAILMSKKRPNTSKIFQTLPKAIDSCSFKRCKKHFRKSIHGRMPCCTTKPQRLTQYAGWGTVPPRSATLVLDVSRKSRM